MGKIKEFLKEFVIIFALVFMVSLIISYVYTILVYGIVIIDWNGSTRLGIIMGVLMPTLRFLKK